MATAQSQQGTGPTSYAVGNDLKMNGTSEETLAHNDAKSKCGPRKFSLLAGVGFSVFAGTPERLARELSPAYVADLFLGYRFGRLRHSGGLFVRVGTLNGNASRRLTNSFYMPITSSIDADEAYNGYAEASAGVFLWETVRLSVGANRTRVALDSGKLHHFDLGIGTVGILVRTGPLRWFFDTGMYFDRKFQTVFLRPSAGLAVQIYMIRFY